MQAQAVIAEQTASTSYSRRFPLPPRQIEMTVRLEIPEEDGADVGIQPFFTRDTPKRWEGWDDLVHQRLYDGVHAGLALVDAPLPDGGIGLKITRLRVSPSLASDTDEGDVQRLTDTLETLVASTVAALWTGLTNFRGMSVS